MVDSQLRSPNKTTIQKRTILNLQVLVFKLEARSTIDQIQLLGHNFMIPKEIEIWLGDLPMASGKLERFVAGLQNWLLIDCTLNDSFGPFFKFYVCSVFGNFHARKCVMRNMPTFNRTIPIA